MMITLREQAIEFIKTIPDDKIVYILDVFKGLEGFMADGKVKKEKTSEKPVESAMGICKKYANIDLIHLEKDAWGIAMEAKHADHYQV